MKHILFFSALTFICGGNLLAQSEIAYTYVEQMPEFPGGEEAMMKFLLNNIKYPDSAKIYGVAGKVYAKFIVNADGKVSDIQIVKGIGMGCDQEVIRVLTLMPNWQPGKQNGKAVPVYFTLPVSFYLYSNDDIAPSYIGGETAWKNFLDQHSRIKISSEDDAKHQVIIKVEVDKDGNTQKVSVDKSAGKTFDDEALRLIALVGKWNPATKNGKADSGTALIQFNFK